MARPKRKSATELYYFSGIPLPDPGTELCTAQNMTLPERIASDPVKKQLWDFIVADMENRNCLSSTYTLLISELVEVVVLLDKCRRKLSEEGEVVHRYDDEGNYLGSAPSAWFSILSKQQPMLIKLLEKIGMSPRDIHYLASPEATSVEVLEAKANDAKGITYFR